MSELIPLLEVGLRESEKGVSATVVVEESTVADLSKAYTRDEFIEYIANCVRGTMNKVWDRIETMRNRHMNG